MNNNKNQDNVPVTCSKCNMVFESDSDYIQHYNDKHRSDEDIKKAI